MANIFKAKTLVGRTGIFSHEVIAPNLVYNTGNQTIVGNKTFVDNTEVQGTGIFNSVDLNNINEAQFSGVTINLVDTNTYVSGGWIYISGNPVLTGNSSLSTLNLNNIVYTTGNQTILGIKDFDQINVSGIKFDVLTTTQTPAHQEGILYYSDDNKTLNLDLDVANLKLLVGQENIIRAKNLTSTTMSPGTVVYINGAQGNTPLVQRSIATGDSTSARTLGIAAHSINDNSKGYFTTFGLVEGIDTSAYSIGQTLYLSHEVSGGLTGVKPQAPNHIVRIGNVIDQGANGSIFVDVQNGFEIDELHDVRIINQKNNDGIVYNSGSGLWLNTPVALANEVVYLTGSQTVSGIKTFSDGISTSNIYGRSGVGVGPSSLSLIGMDRAFAPFTNNFIGGGIDITAGSGNLAGGSIGLYAGKYGNVNYGGSISLIANNIYFNPDNSSTRTVSFFKSAAGGYTNNLIISQSSIDVYNTFTISGVTVTPAIYVNTTTAQTINGLKTFTTGIDIYNGLNPQSLRIFNSTGTNSGEFGLFGWQNNNLIVGPQQSQSGILRDLILTGNNININASGAFNIFDNTNIVGNLTVSGDTTITGHLSAASKSFLIDHPIYQGKKLQYGSLESPYHGIRLTDKNKLSADSIKVNLPDYISALVNDEKVNIQLTNINHDKTLFVKDVNINENHFIVGMNRGWFDKNEYEFYWSFTAERKDIPKLIVEF